MAFICLYCVRIGNLDGSYARFAPAFYVGNTITDNP
jgi:hypothetical protein